MLIANKFEVPDKCPADCPFTDDIGLYGQNAICGRCPVFCCEEDVDGMALVPACEYRPDWAAEWEKFFKGENKCPKLLLEKDPN